MNDNDKLELVKELVESVTDLFEDELRKKVVNSSETATIMYDVMLNLVHMFAKSSGFDEEDVHAHVRYIFNHGKELN